MDKWVQVGKEAPDFTLPADDGRNVELSELRGSPVVLYFYPRDDTPGCTKEACAFRDSTAKLEKLGARVLGISPDGVDSHEKFSDKFDLNFPLLADPDHKVAEEYGAWGDKIRFGTKSKGIRRSTFVIDADGVVQKGLESRQRRRPRPASARGAGRIVGLRNVSLDRRRSAVRVQALVMPHVFAALLLIECEARIHQVVVLPATFAVHS